MKKIIMFGLMILLVATFASAEDVFKQGTVVDLKVPCVNNNTYCSSSSVCNLTIFDTDNLVVINNGVMQNQSAYHNYTLNETHTANSGEYVRNVVCIDNGQRGYSSVTFLITPTGESFDTSSVTGYAVLMGLMFAVTIFFLIFSKSTQNPAIQLFFNVIGYITMALTVGTGWVLSQSIGVQSGVSSLVQAMVFIVGIVLVVIMYYIFINSTKQALALMKSRKGYDDGEDYGF